MPLKDKACSSKILDLHPVSRLLPRSENCRKNGESQQRVEVLKKERKTYGGGTYSPVL